MLNIPMTVGEFSLLKTKLITPMTLPVMELSLIQKTAMRAEIISLCGPFQLCIIYVLTSTKLAGIGVFVGTFS